MTEYINKEFYKEIPANERHYINLSASNIKAVMDKLNAEGIPFSATLSNYKNVVTVRKSDSERAAAIVSELTPKQGSDVRIIGNIEYKYISDKRYINMDSDTALKVAAIMSGDNNNRFSGRIVGDKATITVSGDKAAADVRRIADNIKNADLLTELSEAGFERVEANNGFVNFRNKFTGDIEGFDSLDMVREMFEDKDNEFFHPTVYRIALTSDAYEDEYYISCYDNTTGEEKEPYYDSNGTVTYMPTFRTVDAALDYAASENLTLSNSNEELDKWRAVEIERENEQMAEENRRLIADFPMQDGLYPDHFSYNPDDNSFKWTYFNPDGDNGNGIFVEKRIDEQDIYAAYTAKKAAVNEAEGREAFLNYIFENCRESAIDIYSGYFADYAKDYINKPEAVEEYYGVGANSTHIEDITALISHLEDSCAEIKKEQLESAAQTIETEKEISLSDQLVDLTDSIAKRQEEFTDCINTGNYDGASAAAAQLAELSRRAEQIKAMIQEEAITTEDNKIQSLTAGSEGIAIDGREGTWYVIDTQTIGGKELFLLESENYGDEAACLIVDGNRNILMDEVFNGFEDYIEENAVPEGQMIISGEVASEMWYYGFDVYVNGEKLGKYDDVSDKSGTFGSLENKENTISAAVNDVTLYHTADTIASTVFDISKKYYGVEKSVGTPYYLNLEFFHEDNDWENWRNDENEYANAMWSLLERNYANVENFFLNVIEASRENNNMAENREAALKVMQTIDVFKAGMEEYRPANNKVTVLPVEEKSYAEQLYTRVNDEYSHFIGQMKKESPDMLVRSAAEIADKEKITQYILEGTASLSDEQYEALLSRENPLDEIYEQWLQNGELSSFEDVGIALEETADRILISLDRENSRSEEKVNAVLAVSQNDTSRYYVANNVSVDDVRKTIASSDKLFIDLCALGGRQITEAQFAEYSQANGVTAVDVDIDEQTMHVYGADKPIVSFDDIKADFDEIAKALDLENNTITFSVVAIEGEKPVVVGSYIDKDDITALEEYQDYIYDTGRKNIDVTVDYYTIGMGDNESYDADTDEKEYISEHLDEVLNSKYTDRLESETYFIATPAELLEEISGEEEKNYLFTVAEFEDGSRYVIPGEVGDDNIKDTEAWQEVKRNNFDIDNVADLDEDIRVTYTVYQTGIGEAVLPTAEEAAEIEADLDEILSDAVMVDTNNSSVRPWEDVDDVLYAMEKVWKERHEKEKNVSDGFDNSNFLYPNNLMRTAHDSEGKDHYNFDDAILQIKLAGSEWLRPVDAVVEMNRRGVDINDIDMLNIRYVSSDGTVGEKDVTPEQYMVYLAHSEERTNAFLAAVNAAEERVKNANTPIYTKSFAEAREQNEVELFRASKKENISCAHMIDALCSKHYNNNRLDTQGVLSDLMEQYSLERIALILAANIANKDWDGRISDENKAWAKALLAEYSIADLMIPNGEYYLTTHPGLQNLFANTVRESMEKNREIIDLSKLSKITLSDEYERGTDQPDDFQHIKNTITFSELNSSYLIRRNKEFTYDYDVLPDLDEGDTFITRQGMLKEVQDFLEAAKSDSDKSISITDMNGNTTVLKGSQYVFEVTEDRLAFVIPDVGYVEISERNDGSSDYAFYDNELNTTDRGMYNDMDVTLRQALTFILKDAGYDINECKQMDFDELRSRVEEKANKSIPVYTKSPSAAREQGEIELYRASRKENAACADMIDAVLSKHYHNNRIDSESALNDLLERFSSDRIALVVALNIKSKDWDGRISRENKEWANEFLANFAPEIREHPDGCFLTTHPGILNLFANTVQSHIEQEKTIEASKYYIDNLLDVNVESMYYEPETETIHWYALDPNGDNGNGVFNEYIIDKDFAKEAFEQHIPDEIIGYVDGNCPNLNTAAISSREFTKMADEHIRISEIAESESNDNYITIDYSSGDDVNKIVADFIKNKFELDIAQSRNSPVGNLEGDEGKQFEKAKEYISNYLAAEFLSENVSFDDLKHISAGYTELGEKNEYSFQMEIDLVDLEIRYLLDDENVKTESYNSLEEMNELALSNLNFDEFLSEGTSLLEEYENNRRNTLAEKNNTLNRFLNNNPKEVFREIVESAGLTPTEDITVEDAKEIFNALKSVDISLMGYNFTLEFEPHDDSLTVKDKASHREADFVWGHVKELMYLATSENNVSDRNTTAEERAEQDNFPKYEIYQIPAGERYHDIRFTSYDHLEKMGQLPDRFNYEMVYSGRLDDIDDNNKLEGIFIKFNLDRPEDFAGHSLSVSDVVVIEDENGKSAHFVDRIGFKDITDIFLELDRKKEQDIEQVNINDYATIRFVNRSEWDDMTLSDAENPAFEEVTVSYSPNDDGSYTKYHYNKSNSAFVDTFAEENNVSGEEMLDELAKYLEIMELSSKPESYHFELIDRDGNNRTVNGNNLLFVMNEEQPEISENSVADNELERSMEDGVIGSMGYPVDEMNKAFEAENSRTDYGYEGAKTDETEAEPTRKKSGSEIEVGDKFLYNDREYTVTSEKGIYPDDVGVSYEDNAGGRPYEITQNIDRYKLAENGVFLGNPEKEKQMENSPVGNSGNVNSYEPKIGDLIEYQEKLFQITDINGDEATLQTADTLLPETTMVSITDLITSDSLTVIEENGKPAPVAKAAEQPAEDKPKAQNFVITDDDFGVAGGAKTRYADNVAAIKTLKAIEAENRTATPEEQKILSKYTGWGAIPQAFDINNDKWRTEYAELRALLTPEEYDAARKSTMNAHYTSPTVISAIYEGLKNLGFESGKILEPAVGIGNFFGAMPEGMRNSQLFGVELDSLTGRIAQQLYPEADIQIKGFEQTAFADNSFDVAIGNVPFGEYRLNDRRYNDNNFLIHDYFFAKALDKVRPGGVVAFVTSKGTLDKENSEVRKYLAQRAELLGAIRLPNNAFKANAGTEVTSDIIFLQKRERPIEINPDDVEWLKKAETPDGFSVNNYFVQHPEMVLGKIVEGNKMYGNAGKDTSCIAIEGADLKQQLSEAMKNIHGQYRAAEIETAPQNVDEIPAPANSRKYSFYAVDGNLYYREAEDTMKKVTLPTDTLNRAIGLIGLRDNVRELLNLQLNNSDGSLNGDIAESRKALNDAYDSFVAKYGNVSDRKNAKAMQGDDGYNIVSALEIKDEKGKVTGKADIFTHDTVKPKTIAAHVDTAEEALILSISEKAKVDFEFMSELCGMDKDKLISELSGQIYRLPQEQEKYVTADEYLTGNIRKKLRELENAPEDMDVSDNRKALEAAMPPRVEAKDISVKLGAHWVDPKYIEDFIKEKFNPNYETRRDMSVQYSAVAGTWKIEDVKAAAKKNYYSTHTYGTERMNAYAILEAILNNRDIQVKDRVKDEYGYDVRDEKGNYVLVINDEETKAARRCANAMKAEFEDWIFRDPERREALVQKYNEVYNSIRHREYDGSHLSFVGMNRDITLKEHQKNAVARGLYGGNSLLAHAVGAGKTFEMIAIAMEGKRLGLHNKCLFAVPNALTEQMGNDFRKLYPNANILVATQKDFERENRLQLLGKIAANDWDAVIVGHSQFDRMGLSPERERAYLVAEVNKLRRELEMAAAESGGKKSFTVKQIEKSLASYEGKLEKLNDAQVKDGFIDFEQLGFDKIFVDESHMYKNLATATKMHNVSGLGSQGSARAFNLLMKSKYLDEITGGRGLTFASGTPIITGYLRSEMPILRCLSKRASQQVVLILIFILYFSKFSLHFLNGLKSISFVKK